MKSLLIAAPALCAGAVLALASPRTEAQMNGQQRAEAAGKALVGSPAPGLALKSIDGETIDLARLYGKQAVYLKFWATWCVPCRQQMPHLKSVFEKAGPDLAVIAIDSGFNDSLDAVRGAQRELGLRMPIVLDDGEAGAAFNLRVTPQHIVIGRDGRILYVGHLADDRLDAALLKARSEPEPGSSHVAATSPSTSPQYGPRYGVGDLLPDLAATLLDGSTFKARDPANKSPTVLVFMSPWCEEYLAKSRPAMSKSCRDLREQADALATQNTEFRWLGVASGLWATQGDLRVYRDQFKVALPLAADESGAWFRSFRVMNVPTVLVADANGRIVRRIDKLDESLSTQLERLDL